MILIGEMRDEETVGTALSAAETGHLVLSTLHTIDAVETLNRIIDFFPPHHHQQIRAMLAGALRGVISQRLIPTVDGKGRVAACEVLTMTGRVRDMIVDPKETGKLGEAIADGAYYGMQTFDQALLHLHQEGKISMDDALKAATHPHDFKLLVASDGPALELGGPDLLSGAQDRLRIAARASSGGASRRAQAGSGRQRHRSPSTRPGGPPRPHGP